MCDTIILTSNHIHYGRHDRRGRTYYCVFNCATCRRGYCRATKTTVVIEAKALRFPYGWRNTLEKGTSTDCMAHCCQNWAPTILADTFSTCGWIWVRFTNCWRHDLHRK